MRVAVNARFMRAKGNEGVGRFSKEVLFRLMERHPEWAFYILFDQPWDKGFHFPSNAKPKLLLPPAKTKWLWLFWFDWVLPLFFKRYKIDVFLSFDGYASLRSKVPTVLVVHDLAYLHFPEHIPAKHLRFYREYVSRYCERANRLVSVSEFTAQDIAQQFKIPEEKIVVAYNGPGISDGPLSPATQQAVRDKFSEGQPYFLYLGAIHPRKNIARLLLAFDAFKQKSKAPIKLLLSGRMAWKTGSVKDAWEAMHYREDVQFLGFVPDEDIPALLGSCTAFVYVSLFEGFGIPVLEAMHAEVPVITSDRSSMPEVAGEAALLVDPESEPEIALALQQIWENEELRKALVEKGKIQRQKFTWEKAVDVVEQAVMNEGMNSEK